MQGIALLDVIIFIIILYFLITGYRKGFVRQTATVLGLLLAIYLSLIFYLDFVVFLERFLDFSPTLLQFISFALIFIAANLAVHILGEIVKSLLDWMYLESVDRGGGFLLGGIKGLALAYLIVLILSQIPVAGVESVVAGSYFADWLLDLTPVIQETLEEILGRP